MNFLKFSVVITLALGVIGAAAGCQPAANTANTNTSANTNTANANSHTGHTANTAASNSAASAPAADSPTAVYKAAYAARKNKDVAALKKLMSRDLLEFLTDLGQLGDKTMTLDEVLIESGKELKSDETRNEKIDGDKATLEYREDGDDWDVMDFVKEDGVWKMTLPAADDKVTIDNEPKANKK